MAASNTFFEQIPVETVDRIAEGFPEENAIVGDGEKKETAEEVRSHHESWREVAQEIQHERDSTRMSELVDQLITMLDREQLCKSPQPKLDAGNRSD